MLKLYYKFNFATEPFNEYDSWKNVRRRKKWLYITLLSILNRELYLFDEPTSGIDPMSRKLILKRLKFLSNNKSVLISTHQLQDLNNSDSEVIFIDNGVKLYEGNFNEWLSKLKTNNPDEAFEKTIEMNSKLS